MKKLVVIFTMFFMLFSCDSDYIQTVQKIQIDSFSIWVDDNPKTGTLKESIEFWLKDAVLKRNLPKNQRGDTSSIKLETPVWEVEGSNNRGKVIKVSQNNAYITFQTYQDGDYVVFYPNPEDLNIRFTDSRDSYRLDVFISTVLWFN